MIYRLLVLGILAGALGYGHAQPLTVLDGETGLPLEAVSLRSATAGVLTGPDGRADLAPLIGADTIWVQLMGYEALLIPYATLRDGDGVLRLLPDPLSLAQVVLSAPRWRQARQQLPARRTKVSARELALQNPQTAADLLGVSGEVFIQKSQQGGGSPMIRGFSTNRLLYTVDGVRMNTAIFRGGNLQNVISLDPLAMTQAEVLFGPGATVYGSDAIGGVMSFQTLDAPLSPEGRQVHGHALTRYASANQERTGHFDVTISGKKWAAVTSFTSAEYGDLRMGRHGPEAYLRPFFVQRLDSQDVVVTNPDPLVQTPSGYAQINLMQKLRFRPHEDWDLQYGFHYATTTDYDRYDRHIQLRQGRPRSGEWRYGPQVWMMNLLTVAHRGANRFYDEMVLRVAHQRFEESRIDRDLGAAQRRYRLEKVSAGSANLDFVKNLPGGGELFYGLEGVWNGVTSWGEDEDIRTGERVTGPSRYPQADWTSAGVYASGQVPLSPQLRLQGGIRYSYFGLAADFTQNLPFYPFPSPTARLQNGALSGNLGLVYSPSTRWTLSAQTATGFRAPNVDDMGKVFDSEPGAVVIPNADLAAEYAYHGELGLARVFGSWLKVELSGYYTYLDRALVRRNFTLNDRDSIFYAGELSRVQAIQNAAQAQVYGFQVGLEGLLPGGFRFTSRFNVQVGTEELDDGTRNPSRHAAPAFGLSRLSFHHEGLILQLYAQYSAGRTFAQLPPEEQAKPFLYVPTAGGNPVSPAWYTLNLKVLYELGPVFSLSGGVENLTDQRYRPYSSALAGAGRNVILALRARF